MADNLVFQVARFLASGGIAAALNLGVGIILRRWGMTYGASIVTGFIVGTIASFGLNRNFTFRAYAGKKSTQFARFVLIAIVGIGFAYIVGLLVRAVLLLGGLPPAGRLAADAAHIITIGIMTLYSFFLMKHFAFRKHVD